MTNLQPVDFRAVAAKGCFVYCYLRATDSENAKAGSPYYVGIASTATRPIEKHSCAVPKKRTGLIRVLRSGLSWEEACQWEIRYIAHYGRIDNGTGILRNLTDGGEGAVGCIPSQETRQKMAAAQTGRRHSEQTKQKMSAVQKGRTFTDEARRRMSEVRRGKPNGQKGTPKSPIARARMVVAQSAAAAAQLGVCVAWYASLQKTEKIRARRANQKFGVTGAQLMSYMEVKHPRSGAAVPSLN